MSLPLTRRMFPLRDWTQLQLGSAFAGRRGKKLFRTKNKVSFTAKEILTHIATTELHYRRNASFRKRPNPRALRPMLIPSFRLVPAPCVLGALVQVCKPPPTARRTPASTVLTASMSTRFFTGADLYFGAIITANMTLPTGGAMSPDP